jgi:hypothetical protein
MSDTDDGNAAPDTKDLDDEKAGPQVEPETPRDDDSDKGTHPPTVDD